MTELIAEIGINHNGDLEIAKKLIDAAVLAGFDYVKFQKRTLESVYTEEELNTFRESPWGTTTREQKIGIELTVDQYREIDAYCKEKGIKWFASPWDIKSIFHVSNLGACFIKIPSPLITNRKFIEACVKSTELPLILSTGMCTMDMIDEAIREIPQERIYAILHCTSTYPSKNEELNVNCIKTLKERYPWTKIGFSNHNPGLLGMILAMAHGAEIVELHITLDRSMYGSDQAASIEPMGIFKLGKYAKDIPSIMGDGEKVIYDSELPIIKKLRR